MRIIELGKKATQNALADQHGEKANLAELQGRKVILSFHPLAFTLVCAKQMVALEENREEFEKYNAVALGISVDSVPAKHAWAKDLGIRKTQLLSDFWPHGAVAEAYGIFRAAHGYSERAVIILDEEGMVRWSKSI